MSEEKENLICPMEFFNSCEKNTQVLVDSIMPNEEVYQSSQKVMPLEFINKGMKIHDSIIPSYKYASSFAQPPPVLNKLHYNNDSSINICNKEETSLVHKRRQHISSYSIMKKILYVISIINVQEKLYLHMGLYYGEISSADVARLIFSYCSEEVEKVGKPQIIKETIDLMLMNSAIYVQAELIPQHLLSLQNGVLNITTNTLIPHSKDIYTLYAIQGQYIPNVNLYSPKFDAFLNTITNGDVTLIERIYETIGYILSPDIGGKVFFVFQGVPNSGKSVLTTVISKLFTENAVMTLDAHVFSDKYSISELVGKALCISPDLPATPLDEKAVSKIKQITGNDVVSSNQKYERYISFKCRAKIILVTNHPIIIKKDDAAFVERIVTIPFAYSVSKENRNTSLIQELLQERDAIVTKSLQAYYRLVSKHYKFAGEYNLNDIVMHDINVVDASVSVFEFVKQYLEQAKNSIVFTEDAYKKYRQLNPYVTLNEFSQYFKKFTEDLLGGQKDRKRKDGAVNATSCITGIKWRMM